MALKRFALLLLPALLAAGCATTPQEDPVKLRLDDLDARVGRIDRIVSNQSLVQMESRIEAQQEQIRQLSGRIEELQNDNAKLRKEEHDLYADLDKRVNAAASVTAPPATVGDEQTLYDRALDQLKTKDYGAAVESFRSLAAAYPNGQLADNTQYWLGEAYYVTQEYDHAAASFQRVLSNWPNSRKAPDALLKLGYTQIEQGKLPAGKASLQQVAAKYPGTDAAKLATDRLAKLPNQ